MLVTGGEHAAGTPLSIVSATPGHAGEATQHHTAAARLLPGGATASLNLEAACAEDYLARLARRVADPAGDLQVMTEVARGDPAQIIIARTQTRPSILALATHGRAGFDAL